MNTNASADQFDAGEKSTSSPGVPGMSENQDGLNKITSASSKATEVAPPNVSGDVPNGPMPRNTNPSSPIMKNTALIVVVDVLLVVCLAASCLLSFRLFDLRTSISSLTITPNEAVPLSHSIIVLSDTIRYFLLIFTVSLAGVSYKIRQIEKALTREFPV
jgi:hypothetical protein